MVEDVAVTNFRKYIRIDTEQPNPKYYEARDFLFSLGKELGYETWEHECVKGKPIIGITVPGTDTSLQSLLLYSHSDVVPTSKNDWKYDPYEAVKEENGDIYGRGTQDMKCVGIQYIEALRKLQQKGTKSFKRTIHLIFGPDEEIGGKDGMEKFVKTEEFKKLNIGFALDEGLATEGEAFKVYYGERCPWWIKFICHGSPGHGSRFIEDTAGEKFQYILNKALEFRASEKVKLESDSKKNLGDVTTLNVTIINGGVQVNCLPTEFEMSIDMRINPNYNFDEIEKMINSWAKGAGKNVDIQYLQKNYPPCEALFDRTDKFIDTFSTTLEKMGYKFEPEIFTGATDSRFIREAGIHSIGFSPMNKTPTLLHEHNEFLNEKVYLKGVEIYENLIQNLANIY
uniref:N-acyl-aliphatic-L-amino acid amidohydrolase n=1 Tax=Parastrongyloides trichosuri TaxID=131310 RepID=A0A0N4Z1P0_PARTI